jgi:hypothetical protein
VTDGDEKSRILSDENILVHRVVEFVFDEEGTPFTPRLVENPYLFGMPPFLGLTSR